MITQKELTDKLDLASRQYYNGLTSEFSDTEFDIKLKELQEMEKESGFIFPNSPTIRVGSDLQKEFKKGEHPKPMFTIENVYDDDGLIKWVEDIKEKYGVNKFNVSIKYDGVSCELWYKNGVFEKALTRGDKLIGDDITENVKTIKNIPMVLPNAPYGMVYIRGEILLPKSRLDAINSERINNGEQSFSNTRNACSGSIKQLDPKITAKRGLIFKAWDCFGEYINAETMWRKTWFLIENGFYYESVKLEDNSVFCTTPFTIIYTNRDEFVNTINSTKKYLSEANLDYDFDGIVIKVNDIDIQDKIGTKDTRAIEWGIARKWNEELEVETTLLDIDWQVGRTGILTPVGRLDPVECNGVVISNVTLHNWDFIGSMGILIGDKLRITRSGGVIPYVIGRRSGEYGYIPKKPNACPACGSDIYQDGAFIKCTNYDCSAQSIGRILQFCSKECMDVRNIGDRVVEDLVLFGIVENISDLYTLKDRYTIEELVDILGDGYGSKSIEKMLASIELSKEKTFANVIAGLSIPNVGKVVARQLSKEFKNIDNLIDCTYDRLISLDGIGEVMANDICWWFSSPQNIEMCNKLKEYGLKMSIENDNSTVKIEERGVKVCFTGKSSKFKGDEVEEYLKSNGFTIAGVSKSLNYLIIGDKPGGSKVKKAEELGITVITENEFYKKYNLE
jgi:DNA ligase (NAD+)